MTFPVIWCNIILVRKIQHNKKQEKRGNHTKFEVKVNGSEQIGFVKEGKTRMTWTPIESGELYDHNVKEVIISEATTGRRIDVIVAKH